MKKLFKEIKWLSVWVLFLYVGNVGMVSFSFAEKTPLPPQKPVPTPLPSPTNTPAPKPSIPPLPNPTSTPSPRPSNPPLPMPTQTPRPTPTPSATPRPNPVGRAIYQYTCMCGEGDKEINCGTIRNGIQCDCPPQPAPSHCDSQRGTVTYYSCNNSQGGQTCGNKNPPNSYSPPLAKGQCRITWVPQWGLTATDVNCGSNQSPPPQPSPPRFPACTLGQITTLVVSCVPRR